MSARKYLFGLVAVIAVPVGAASLQSEFGGAWLQRASDYERKIAAAKEQQDAAIRNFAQAEDEAKAKERALPMINSAVGYGYAQGRWAELKDFLVLMDQKPSAARTEMWFQDQSDKLQGMGRQADAKLSDAKEQGDLPEREYVVKVLEAAAYNGLVRGAVDELTLLDRNVATLSQAKDQQAVRRREGRARFLAGLGAALRQSAQSQSWSATCSTTNTLMGSATNCFGSR